MSKEFKVVFYGGKETGDFPIAVKHTQESDAQTGRRQDGEGTVVDPIFNDSVTRNLYGRIMTLVEATTEQYKLQSVKDLFGKELRDWESEVYRSAQEVVHGGDSSSNIYTKGYRLI